MDYIISITPFLLQGLKLTAQIYFITILLMIPVGAICAIGKMIAPAPIKWLLNLYTWAIRGTPLLLLLFFFYFGLPVIGIRLPGFVAAVVVYVLNYGALLTEIFRGGLQSIDKGQFEAAKALGLTYTQTMFRIIIPQTIRRVLPPTSSEVINLLKDTALLAAIGMPDLLRVARQVFTRDFNITSFIMVFALYLFLSSILVKIFAKLEEKFALD